MLVILIVKRVVYFIQICSIIEGLVEMVESPPKLILVCFSNPDPIPYQPCACSLSMVVNKMN